MTPGIGALVGTGMMLACYGTGGYIFPFWFAGTLVGAAAGVGVGGVGLATDLYKRSDCEFNQKDVHFNLQSN
ncbi:MAG: hypothetical protein LW832_10025 [Parachlamydia sp.]|nr:hypothetical protein [Parachlamydia sp.]